MSLKSYLNERIPALDAEILEMVDGAGDCELYNLVRYQLGWMDREGRRLSSDEAQKHGGKKLRPALTLLACEVCSGDWRQALPAAAAIELIHNFSLVHDDVEDEDLMRRHRLTVWGAWNVAMAVNCGSAMQALVYRAILRSTARQLPSNVTLRLLELFTDAILEMTEGQHLDIAYQEHGSVSVVQYFDMTSRKTGALLEAALRAGARVAGAPAPTEERLARFGRSFGLAFQARDDYLGAWGDPAQSGKAVGADIIRKKKSLPLVYALQHDPAGAGAVVRQVMAEETISTEDCDRVLEAMEHCGARSFTENAARRHTQDAVDALEDLPPGPAREALLEFAQLASMRRY